MDRNGVLLAAFVLYLLIVDCYTVETDTKKTDTDSVLDPKDGKRSDEKSSKKTGTDAVPVKVDGGNKIGVPGGRSVEGVEKDSDKHESRKQLGSDGKDKVEKDKARMSKDVSAKGDKEKGGSAEGVVSEVVKDGSAQGGDSELPTRKENSRSEECDASIRCTDVKNKLVACLQVPGNESPDLSLLIQNKGIKSLTVKITAPDSVHLEKNTVQLQEKEDGKVKVTIGNSIENSTMIFLKVGEETCELDFRDAILPTSRKETEQSPQSGHTNVFRFTYAIYVFIAAMLLVGAAWAFVKFRRGHLLRYQKVDMVLPVSEGGKMESDASDEWDNNWGDGWEDEEAPKTPSQPISNLSSKGLASRRSNNKDGWQNSWKD